MADSNVPTFLGRVVHPLKALLAAHGLRHAREVWYPKSQADVASALAQPRQQKMFVRSGTQALAATDVVDAAGGIVLNLAELTKVGIDQGILKAEVAAATGTVGKELARNNLALPLGDNPNQSIASNLLYDEPSCLMRTLGRLPDYVTSLSVVAPDGHALTLPGATALSKTRALNAVITEVEFKPASADNLWMIRKTFPYPGKESFSAIAKALFLNAKLPRKSDLVLDAFSSRHDISLVRVTALGSADEDESTLEKRITDALVNLPSSCAMVKVEKNHHDSDVIKTIADTGYGIPLDPQIDTHRIPQIVEQNDNVNEILDLVTGYVHRGLGVKDDNTGMIDDDLDLFIRLQLNRDDRLELSGFTYTSKNVSSSFPTRLTALASVAPTPPPNTLTLEASRAAVSEAPIAPAADASAAPAAPPTTAALDIFPAPAPRIPGFKGQVFIPSDFLFRLHADQYATSSFPVEDMTPSMVAYPEDLDDIKSALGFAAAQRKSVVARSGGHQYCGKSSGGSSTIVLAMDAFNQFEQVAADTVEVGPAVRLTDLAANFKNLGMTIPHGECPFVNIGGHGQTGGFGHLLRGFGLALDHIVAITIVLADATVKTIARPPGTPAPGDDELFWGVLGGNAGSFGIVVNYRIQCVLDGDHPNSYGYAATRIYSKARFTNLLKQVQIWTKAVEDGSQPEGIDFTMSVESNYGLNPFPILLVELVHSNLGGATQPVDGDMVFQSIIQAADETLVGLLATTKGTKPLSYWSDHFVRRYPDTTLDGREFKYPYHKRVNCTSGAITDKFIEKFVDVVDQVVTGTEGVYLVFQMMIGGGRFRTPAFPEATSIPRRGFVFAFVFDLFYADGFEDVAAQLQIGMQSIVDAEFSPGQEGRLFWGSFGDTNMAESSIQNFYYDDLEKYARLQQLKKNVDPNDVFHTSFTVQLPTASDATTDTPSVERPPGK